MPSTIHAVRGASNLGFDAYHGIVDAVEKMHQTIACGPLPGALTGVPPGRAHGRIAALVYQSLRLAGGVLREGVDQSLSLLAHDETRTASPRQEAILLGAVNGICGDHLEASGNPLALSMVFTTPQRELRVNPEDIAAALPEAGRHLLVLVHGLCLSNWGWRRRDEDDLGRRLQRELGLTPLYLQYNSGRHVSHNGRELAAALERLCVSWPVPLESLSLVGHSMGGLLIRSACHYGLDSNCAWPALLRDIVCLGTPHRGAPLEKAGHQIDAVLRRLRYVEPLLFGQRRSAGIKDLRHGYLIDQHWQRDAGPGQAEKPLEPPPGVSCYYAAASVGRDERDPSGHLLGDLLVRRASATASADPAGHAVAPPTDCRVFHQMNHFDLIDAPEVQQQVVDWLARG